MDPQNIDWIVLKEAGYWEWRKELYERTLRLLTSSDELFLAQYNHLGYFHKVLDKGHFEQMKDNWERLEGVPQEWFAKGYWPGIWTAMFDPSNTYSFHIGPIYIIRFYFKDGYRIYDRMNPNHKKLLEAWKGWDDKNPWEYAVNEHGESLEQRMKLSYLPSHKKFFKDHKFGATIGYSDYISPVVLLEDSVADVEFLNF